MRQLQGIDPVALVADSEQLVVTRVADEGFGHVWPEEIVEPGGLRAFFKRDVEFATQAPDEISDRLGLGLNDRFRDRLAFGVEHDNHKRGLMHVHPDVEYLLHGHSFRWKL